MEKSYYKAALLILFLAFYSFANAQDVLKKVEELQSEDNSGVLVYYSKAKAFYDFGKFDWAARDWGYLLENFHKIDTSLIRRTGLDSINVLELRAISYSNLGEVEAAIADYEAINKLVPNDSIFELNSVRVYFANHQCEKAVALIDSTEHNFEELYDAAHCYVELNDSENALFYAQKAIEHEPNNYLGYKILGKTYQLKGDSQLACDTFEEAIAKLRASKKVPVNKKGHLEEVLLRERGYCKK